MVPVTDGVTIRRKRASREISANWTPEETSIRLDNMAGPPATNALMQTAMKAVPLETLRAYPEPKRHIRKVWSTVPSTWSNS